MRSEGTDEEAVPFFKRAVELDPSFASAYLQLAVSNEGGPAADYFSKAYALRERASDRERCTISAMYHVFVTGDLDKAKEAWEVCARTYPQYCAPHLSLGVIYAQVGDYEKAVRETEQAHRAQPNCGFCYGNLMCFYAALNRFEDAKAIYRSAVERKVDNYVVHVNMYAVALTEGDNTEMQRQLAWAAGKSGVEHRFLSVEADMEAYAGRMAKARELSRRSSEAAKRVGQLESAAQAELNAALRVAEFGYVTEAQENVSAALRLTNSREVRTLAALVLARVGDISQAQAIADRLASQYASDTLLNFYWLPSIRAAIELNRKNPAKAIELLRLTASYELGSPPPMGGTLYPAYLRGAAYLMAGHGQEAASEFQKILEKRGLVMPSVTSALAPLGSARAYALQGDRAKARAAYQEFLALWKNADPDIPILKGAKAEYAKLQ